MEIISVDNNWDRDTLRIDINLGNICNYKCWYCWPESHMGTDYWPNLELLKKNITHLINYYKVNAGKKIFNFHFVGGEPTHWPKLLDFIKFLKENFNCVISMTSNGSKKVEYWQKIVPYFDIVHLSCHHEFVNLESFRDICDLLYKNNVIVSVSMMMDPLAWDTCMNGIEYLKQSKYSWTIRYVEIIGDNIQYTSEQVEIINRHRARKANIFWFLKNNKHYISKVKVKDDREKIYKFKDNEIVLKKLNHFTGWSCSVGVNWVHISNNGTISGTCGQLLYGEDQHYNLYSDSFEQDFTPKLINSVCDQIACWCTIETVMPKYKLTSTKVIPIYEH
jgi:sulfatase maturation enzyme AslB (radical SAM superfamily)